MNKIKIAEDKAKRLIAEEVINAKEVIKDAVVAAKALIIEHQSTVNDAREELKEIRQRERILLETSSLYARKWAERLLLSILGLFGIAIIAQLIKIIGL